MEQSCHRCGTSVSRDDTFCPVCGAPQLNFDASLQDSAEGNAQPAIDERPGQVRWRDAISAVIIVAVPAGILCGVPLLAAGSLIWVMGGASVVIMLYKKKHPLAQFTSRQGFRIGTLAGVVIAYVSVAAAAILRVVQRYPMHIGQTIDREYESVITQSTSVFATSPDTQAQMRSFFNFMLTPDGRAAWSFMNMITVTLMTILFAAIGGYVGVRLFSGRRVA